jgi:hypothetical protein
MVKMLYALLSFLIKRIMALDSKYQLKTPKTKMRKSKTTQKCRILQKKASGKKKENRKPHKT